MSANISEPVSPDLAETLSQVEEFLRRYIVFPSEAHSLRAAGRKSDKLDGLKFGYAKRGHGAEGCQWEG
jgi:hypothetical protein